MATFTKLNLVITIKKAEKKVQIYKFIKEGTKQTFFAPEFEGKRINKILFAKKYNAEELAYLFLNRN